MIDQDPTIKNSICQAHPKNHSLAIRTVKSNDFFLRSWWLQDSSSDSSVNISAARCFGRNHGSALNLQKNVVQKQLESPVLVGLQTDTPDTIELYRNLSRSWVAAGHLVFDIRQNSFVLPWFLRPCCLFGIWTCIDIDGGPVLLTGDGASVGWLRKRHTEVRGVEELLNRVSDNAVRDSLRLKMNTSKLNQQRTPFTGCYRGCGRTSTTENSVNYKLI